MNAEKPLAKELMFWVSIILPIALAAILCILIAEKNKLIFNFEIEGLNDFLNYMKIPIGIASLAFPFSAIIIANHRSKLTVTQIRELQSTNRMSNYYKHREDFFRLCKESGELWAIKFTIADSDYLYTHIFPDINPSNFSIFQVSGETQREYFEAMCENINSTFKCIEIKWAEIDIDGSNSESKHDALKFTCSLLDTLYGTLGMRVENKFPLAHEIHGGIYSNYWLFIPDGNPYDAFSSIENFVYKLQKFCMVETIRVNAVEGLPWDDISKMRADSLPRNAL